MCHLKLTEFEAPLEGTLGAKVLDKEEDRPKHDVKLTQRKEVVGGRRPKRVVLII